MEALRQAFFNKEHRPNSLIWMVFTWFWSITAGSHWAEKPKADSYELLADDSVKQLGLDLTGVHNSAGSEVLFFFRELLAWARFLGYDLVKPMTSRSSHFDTVSF